LREQQSFGVGGVVGIDKGGERRHQRIGRRLACQWPGARAARGTAEPDHLPSINDWGRLDRTTRDRQPLQLLRVGQVGGLGEQRQDRPDRGSR
jgi:hypothetical protein